LKKPFRLFKITYTYFLLIWTYVLTDNTMLASEYANLLSLHIQCSMYGSSHVLDDLQYDRIFFHASQQLRIFYQFAEPHHADAAPDPLWLRAGKMMPLRLRFHWLAYLVQNSKNFRFWYGSGANSCNKNDEAPCGSVSGSATLVFTIQPTEHSCE
jgi:hypothetical protein